MSAGFNLEPGARVIVGGVELTMERMVPALLVGDPDDTIAPYGLCAFWTSVQ